MDASSVSRVSRLFEAGSVGHRLHMLDILAAGETPFGDIQSRLGLRQQNTTSHLKILRLRGLVSCRRVGKRVFYRITDEGARLLGVAREMVA